MNELRFFAHGEPKPQGSKTPGVTANGRLFVRENNTTAHKAWRETVRQAAATAIMLQGWDTLHDTAILVTLQFRFPARKSGKDVDNTPKITTPDLDKLIRSVLDSLTDAYVWDDDSRVVSIQATKYYVIDPQRTGVVVSVAPLGA